MTLQLAFPLDFIWDEDFKHNNIQYQYPTLQSIFLAKSSSHGNNQMIKKIKKIESVIAKNHKKKRKKKRKKEETIFEFFAKHFNTHKFGEHYSVLYHFSYFLLQSLPSNV